MEDRIAKIVMYWFLVSTIIKIGILLGGLF